MTNELERDAELEKLMDELQDWQEISAKHTRSAIRERVAELIQAAIEHEREACAKVVDDRCMSHDWVRRSDEALVRTIATRIRARARSTSSVVGAERP